METVRHLDCLRCALAPTFGIRTCSISNDDFDTRVRAQPIGEDLGGTLVEQVNGPVSFQIEQQRAIATLLPPQCDVINAENPRATAVGIVGNGMQQVEQCVGADR